MDYNKFAGDPEMLSEEFDAVPIYDHAPMQTGIYPAIDYSEMATPPKADVLPIDDGGNSVSVTLPADIKEAPTTGGIDKKWLWIGGGVLALYLFRKQIFGK